MIGWTGAKTHITIYQFHNSGRNVADNVGSIADPSYVDALPTTRLVTAWFEQNFNDRFSLRIGQLAADDEFMISPTVGGYVNGNEDTSYGGLFNSIFGWAGILGPDMIHGGPSSPLAAPGARLKVNATDNITLLAAVFFGDPAGRNCTGNPEECNKYGSRSASAAARCGWANYNTSSLETCLASTRSAPGTRPRITPTSISA